MHTLDTFDRDGFGLIENVLNESQVDQLWESIDGVLSTEESLQHKGSKYATRHLLKRSALVREYALSLPLKRIAEQIVGNDAIAVRAMLMDKTPEANWYVAWHQDLTIAVSERLELEGYGPWSTKHGVIHVQPPVSILESMVALRVHLDDCPIENGAIRFIGGSHKHGIMSHETIAIRKSEPYSVLAAKRGDVIAMRPLILHSSAPSAVPGHRRVLHIEYANVDLPAGLRWAEA